MRVIVNVVGCVGFVVLIALLSRVESNVDIRDCIPDGRLVVNVTYVVYNKTVHFQRVFNLTTDGQLLTGCNNRHVTLRLLSDDGYVHFVIGFEKGNRTDDPKWTVTDATMVSALYALPQLAKRNKVNATTPVPSIIFQSAFNATQRCDGSQIILSESNKVHASLIFIQGLMSPSSNLPPGMVDALDPACAETLTSAPRTHRHGEYMVPILLGASLSVVVMLLLAGYYVHKKIEAMGYISF
ncbi:hypothetical protein DPMN_099556 [Dreissena polymorpha]|uniref:Uncharacterized protein n=1 Tax=Dreissena polymorpha TaxID=45954 RepID=A0A9D4LF35_DREPO|nr:hypothetical protein DPMN_099556 [Dreissena polymorpha]